MSSETHKLAAIMFTDIVGYTSIMGSDEQAGLSVLNKNRSLQTSSISKYNGKVLKHMGDGILASFQTVSEAVYCAGEIQHLIKNEDFEIRIGIHQGEVIFSHGDIFGDGVNIASRIESKASPGEILLSESAFSNVKNKKGITGRSLGKTGLKNVDKPIELYCIEVSDYGNYSYNKRKIPFKAVLGIASVFLVIAVIWFIRSVTGSPEIPKRSIAVLYLTNLTGNEDEEHLADGMTEEIIFRLSQVSGFDKVISSTSSREYKKANKNIETIAEELGVAYVLEGSFQKTGNLAKIIVKLIDGSEDNEVWSQTFERPYEAIFEIQKDIAQRIAASLQTRISEEEKELIDDVPTENMEAWEYYRRGLDYYSKATQKWGESPGMNEYFTFALDQLEKAIQSDSSFALAYSKWADVKRMLYHYGLESGPKHKQAIRKAIDKARSLDLSYPDLLYAEGMYQYSVEGNRDSALVIFEELTNKFPNNPGGYLGQSLIYRRINQWEKSLTLQQRVYEFNPRDPDILDLIGETARYQRNFEIASQAFEKFLDLRPDDKLSRYQLGRIGLEWKGIIPEKDIDPIDHYYYNRDWDNFLGSTEDIAFDNEFVERGDQFRKALVSYMKGDENTDSLARLAIEDLTTNPRFRAIESKAIAFALMDARDSLEIYRKRIRNRNIFKRDAYIGYMFERDLASVFLISQQYDSLYKQLEWLLSHSGAGPLTVEVLKLDPLYDQVREDPRFLELINRPEFQVKPGLKVISR